MKKQNKNSRTCRKGHQKSGDNIYLHRGRPECKTCRREAHRNLLEKLKKQLLGKIGEKCTCCGITEWWNLTFDHKIPIRFNGDRHKLHSSMSYYRQILRDENFDDFQTLCYGCNNSKNTSSECRLNHG